MSHSVSIISVGTKQSVGNCCSAFQEEEEKLSPLSAKVASERLWISPLRSHLGRVLTFDDPLGSDLNLRPHEVVVQKVGVGAWRKMYQARIPAQVN